MAAATATAPPDASQEATHGVNPWWIAAAVMLATFMEVLDTSIASVALPYIAGSLSATNDEATWVLTSYLVSNAIILPASNWFSLRFGRKRFLMVCVGIFTLASFACGAAPSLALLLLFRVVQGAGGGALQPISQAVLLESFPPAKRGAAMAVFALGVVVAPVLGPTLGGWLTDTYSWRYAFYINIPIGVLALYMINKYIHDPGYIKNAKVSRFDNLGFGSLIVWVGCLQVILDKGQEVDWFGATLAPLGLRRHGHRARHLHLPVLLGQAAAGQPPRPQRPQLPRRLHPHLPLRHRHLLHRRRPPALLPGAPRLHRLHRRPRRCSARLRSHLRHARHRLPLQQGRPPLSPHLRLRHLRPHHPLLRLHHPRHLAHRRSSFPS